MQRYEAKYVQLEFENIDKPTRLRLKQNNIKCWDGNVVWSNVANIMAHILTCYIALRSSAHIFACGDCWLLIVDCWFAIVFVSVHIFAV